MSAACCGVTAVFTQLLFSLKRDTIKISLRPEAEEAEQIGGDAVRSQPEDHAGAGSKYLDGAKINGTD
jgi:hypothetical protein